MSGYRFLSFIYFHPKKCHRRDQLQQIAIPVSTPSNWGFQLISNSDYEKKVAVALLYDRIKAPTLVLKEKAAWPIKFWLRPKVPGFPFHRTSYCKYASTIVIERGNTGGSFSICSDSVGLGLQNSGKTPWD